MNSLTHFADGPPARAPEAPLAGPFEIQGSALARLGYPYGTVTKGRQPVKARAIPDMEARHPRQLRRVNMDRVLAATMGRPGPLTRAELTTVTGLSAPTVGSLAGELLRLGLLNELGRGPSTGGRRPRALQFNASYGFVAGVVLEARTTRLALSDLAGATLAVTEAATPQDDGPERLLEWMSGLIRGLFSKAGVPAGARLLAVTAGLPGAVDRERGTVVGLMPGFRSWENVAVGAYLEQLLGAPVVVENDVNLAVLGEHWRGAAQGHDTCAFISLDVGIGAGILIGGELHRGHHSLAGEIAVMCMASEYVARDFGTRGCLETLVGLDSIVRRWRPDAGGDPPIRASELVQAARGGDPQAQRVLADAATLIGMAASHVSLVIDPSLLVLGGPLVGTGGELLERVRAVISRVIPRPPKVVCSALGEQAMLAGSLLVATQEARGRLRQSVRDPQGRVSEGVAAAYARPLNLPA
jgi:predicted NBD/HSP70 family sugar kinase